MKRIAIGMLAHVDSGKTTLSEAMLFTAGELQKLGRVDHRDSFLDTNEIERDRGITVFSKQALLEYNGTKITLLDTPGHIDFSAETERTLKVLDYAVLVISATDGVQSHTETLWRLLCHYSVPTFIFINKTDLSGADVSLVMDELKTKLSPDCVLFEKRDEVYETCALLDDNTLEEYEKKGTLSDDVISSAIYGRKIYPCFSGSALRNEGVDKLLDTISLYTIPAHGEKFGAKVYKIGTDEKGQRLTYMKITGGSLKVKTILDGEKLNEIRAYSGVKYQPVQEAFAGEVVAVTGLLKTFQGQGFGRESSQSELKSTPVFSYSVKLSGDTDIHNALTALRKLEQEETELFVTWNDRLQKLDVQLMGEVQLEVLKRILKDRFDIDADFEEGSIIYKETIADTVEGVGHYEPLRHYAEVHLLLEPGERGGGIVIKTKCSEDELDRNWQRNIISNLKEKAHIGTLTGSPITDIKITLVSGKAHKKHTEGGDFREASWRALRQGLMQAQSILLEPYYSFKIEVPLDNVGRVMTDLDKMGAEINPPEVDGEMSVVTGSAPIRLLREYPKEIISFAHGKGKISMSFKGYEPSKEQDKIAEEFGYNPEADVENTPDSVFCSHGSGFIVKWDKVHEHMHLPSYLKGEKEEYVPRVESRVSASDEELLRIFEQTYGKIKERSHGVIRTKTVKPTEYKAKPIVHKDEYLLVDGYNVIFATDELKKLTEDSLDDARRVLIARLAAYQAVKGNNVIVVFDAYKVKGEHREVERVHGIDVVYTKEAETADAYIEKTTKKLIKNYRVRVATSDNLEQIIIFGSGAIRTPARELMAEVRASEDEIREFIKENNKKEW